MASSKMTTDGVTVLRDTHDGAGPARRSDRGPALSALDYIPLFLDFYDRYAALTYEERGRLVWAMLAYTRRADPAPHLTEALSRYCFPNEREVIDRTEKARVERRERQKAASRIANAAKSRRTQSDRNGPNRTESEHNNNDNDNYNNNCNNNNNNNCNNNDNRGAADAPMDSVGAVKPDGPSPLDGR